MPDVAKKPWQYDNLLDSVREEWDAHDKTCKSMPDFWLGTKTGVSCPSDLTTCDGCDVTFFNEGVILVNEDDPEAEYDRYLCECCHRSANA